MVQMSDAEYASLRADRDASRNLLEEADLSLREIRAENLDGSEPAFGESPVFGVAAARSISAHTAR